MPTMKVFFHELMAIIPMSWKPGDTPEITPFLLPPPVAAAPEVEAAVSLQLGRTQRAGIGPAAPGRRSELRWGGGWGGGGYRVASSGLIASGALLRTTAGLVATGDHHLERPNAQEGVHAASRRVFYFYSRPHLSRTTTSGVLWYSLPSLTAEPRRLCTPVSDQRLSPLA